MAKPSTITTWATDVGATADPGSTRRATGFVPGKKLPSKWLNWILNQNGAWLTYLRDLHSEIEFLNKDYFWRGRHSFAVPSTVGIITTPRAVRIASGRLEYVSTVDGTTAATGDTRHTALRLGLAQTYGTFSVDEDDGTLVFINQANTLPKATFEIELPSGATIQQIAIAFAQTNLSSSDDVTVELREVRSYGVGVTTTTTFAADAGGVTIVPSGGGLLIDSNTRYQLRLLGVYKSISTMQRITSGEITWLDPGARNY